jgi:hypothetical protein
VIPKVIHYCWFGGNPVPSSVYACIASWKTACPGYEIRRWDERNFDVSHCRFAREAHAAGRWAFVSDYARLRIVLDHGGIYLDTDVELVKPLDPLLGHDAFFGFQQDCTIATGLGFGAVKGHRFVDSLVAAYENIAFLGTDGSPVTTPCPVRDSEVLRGLGVRLDGAYQEIEGVVILPAEYLSPKCYESGRIRTTPRTIAIHHYDASWHGDLERADLASRRRYARAVGPTVGHWLYRADIRARNLVIKLRRLIGGSS